MSKILAKNKYAMRDYEILDKFEAGIVLLGHEVKSIKGGHINLKGSYVTLQQSSSSKKLPEVWLVNAHIPLYEKANKKIRYEPRRSRKLLIKRKEISHLVGKIREKGLTLVPLTVYSKRGKIKIGFGIGKGLKKYDKREKIKEREDKRKIKQAMRRSV
ncbi:MAG: SsrA-binding protein [uncultured bacterium]|nr:MAG: SsrA-binding protein [uncultured bacterium]